MTFLEFNNQFPTEEKVIDYFVKLRFPETCECVHCGVIIKPKRDNSV